MSRDRVGAWLDVEQNCSYRRESVKKTLVSAVTSAAKPAENRAFRCSRVLSGLVQDPLVLPLDWSKIGPRNRPTEPIGPEWEAPRATSDNAVARFSIHSISLIGAVAVLLPEPDFARRRQERNGFPD